MEKIRVKSKQCPGCDGYGTYEITQEQLDALQSGRGFIHDILPEYGPGVWERFITGYCSDCWDKMFKPMEEG